MWEIVVLDYFEVGDSTAGLFWSGRFCYWTFLKWKILMLDFLASGQMNCTAVDELQNTNYDFVLYQIFLVVIMFIDKKLKFAILYRLVCESCHFERSSNDEFSVEFWMFVLIFFQLRKKNQIWKKQVFNIQHQFQHSMPCPNDMIDTLVYMMKVNVLIFELRFL